MPDGERWFRVCVDSHWDDEAKVASNLAFQWGSNDEGELSGARSDKTTAKETFRHQVEDQRKDVGAVLAIEVEDLTREKLHLHDDSALLPGPPKTPHGHAWLDLKHVPAGKGNPAKHERERVRLRLLEMSEVAYVAPDGTCPSNSGEPGAD